MARVNRTNFVIFPPHPSNSDGGGRLSIREQDNVFIGELADDNVFVGGRSGDPKLR